MDREGPDPLVRLTIRLTPGAAGDRVDGVDERGALRVRVRAAPVDGAANEELVAFLSKLFVVARKSVRILAGESSRSKIVEIEGINESAVHDVVNTSR